MILFSGISPEYERVLKDEIWSCIQFMGMKHETVMDMPTRDRKYFIMKHNKYVEEENSKK